MQSNSTCPMEPTAQERQLHNLTHLPYRTWCQECVTAKGKLEKHMRQPTKQPVIQMDFGFLGLEGDPTDRKLKLVTAVDITSGLGNASLLITRLQHLCCNRVETFLL